MKKTIWFALLAALLLLLAGCAGGTGEETGTKPDETETDTAAVPPEEIPVVLPLAAEGKTDYVIVYGKDTGSGARMAAAELQKYLLQITGASFDVVTDETPETVREIVVGKTNRERAGEFPWEEIGEDGLVIKTDRGKLWLIGEGRGAFYAVYAFLEEYLGWRYFGAGMEVVPSLSMIELEPIEEDKQIGGFISRSGIGGGNELDVLKARGNGCNPSPEFEDIFDKPGALLTGYAHTIAIFAGTGWGGNDSGHDPCLTSEQTFEDTMKCILTGEGTYAWMAGGGLRNRTGVTTVLLTQGDYGESGCCHCDACMARVAEYGWSGHYLLFVNRVAEALKEEFPDVTVTTYAYSWTIDPPKGGVRAADNVRICMCLDDACYAHPYSECHVGGHGMFYENLDIEVGEYDVDAIMSGWMEVTDNPFNIWYYPNLKNTQMPNLSIWTMRENARVLFEHNAAGVGFGLDENFGELRAYLGAKLSWNPYMSEEEFERHMNEFLEYFYGPSWEKVREYLDMLKDYADEGHHQYPMIETVELYPYVEDRTNEYGPTPIVPVEQLRNYKNVDWSQYYQCQTTVTPNEVVTKGRPILEAAMELADTDELKAKIERLTIQIDIVESYSLHQLLTRVVKVTLPNVFRASCDAAVEAGTMAKSEVSTLVNNFRKYITDKTAAEYHEFNRQLAEKIYRSGFTTYRYGEEVPENVEELHLDNVPTSGVWNEGTWYREP